MTTSPRQCPKCNGRMDQGFLLDNTHGGRVVGRWVPGAPVKSFWVGTQLPDEDPVPIGAFRCQSCGFLELYARDDFAAR